MAAEKNRLYRSYLSVEGARGTGPLGSRCAPRFAENGWKTGIGSSSKNFPHFGTNRTGRIL